MTRTRGICLYVCATLLIAALPAIAAKNAANANLTKYKGSVTAVDIKLDTITIKAKKQPTQTFIVTPTTEIKVDKAPAKLADVKVGMHASISSSDGKTAAKIHAKLKTAAATTDDKG